MHYHKQLRVLHLSHQKMCLVSTIITYQFYLKITQIWLFSTEIIFLVYFIIWGVKIFHPYSQRHCLQHLWNNLYFSTRHLFYTSSSRTDSYTVLSFLFILLFSFFYSCPRNKAVEFFFISAFLSSLWVQLEAEMLSWTLFRSLRIYSSSNSTTSSLTHSLP